MHGTYQTPNIAAGNLKGYGENESNAVGKNAMLFSRASFAACMEHKSMLCIMYEAKRCRMNVNCSLVPVLQGLVNA